MTRNKSSDHLKQVDGGTARGRLGGTPPGPWVALTQAQYNALATKDPNTLYVITG